MAFAQFPFLSPLNLDTVKRLESRAANKEYLNTLMPFAILSSAAVVTNTPKTTKEVINILQTEQYGSFAYKGCVIANTTDILKRYQTGNTIVGYDLDGKAIEVKGEANRRASVPLIESIEIDSMSGNNTLKIAQIKIKIFTLKQLEMFELFFLRPGMNVVLEYGWNSTVRRNFELEKEMFATKNHTEYVTKYAQNFSNSTDGYREAKLKYVDLLVKSNGDYDFMGGKVTNFNYSVDTDGTYNLDLTLTSGNELTTYIPTNQEISSDSSANVDKKKEIGFKSWVGKLSSDLGRPEFNKIFGNENLYKNEFFNWDAAALIQKDSMVSKKAYISFKLILDIINNIKLFQIEQEIISYTQFFEDAEIKKPIIPISSNYNIISPTDDFILPGDLPSIEIPKNPKKENALLINQDIRENCKISGKSFNISNDKKAKKFTIYNSNKESKEITSTIGNLLNLYFNYETFISIYKSTYTIADIVNGVLETINENMFGLCKLVLQKESDAEVKTPLTITDLKLKMPNEALQPKQEVFRFNIGANNYIVKEFNFSNELSELMQAQALYSTQLAYKAAGDGKEDDTSLNIRDEKELVDFNFSKNSDDYYSINVIENKLVKDSKKINPPKEDKPATTEKKQEKIKESEKESQEAIKNLTELRNSKYIKFKLDLTDTKENPKNMIYTDSSLIQSQLPKKQNNTSSLTHINITLAIDGTAGIRCGEYFNIDGVPEIYNKHGIFQIQNVKHGISSNGWQTTIEAGWRIKHEE